MARLKYSVTADSQGLRTTVSCDCDTVQMVLPDHTATHHKKETFNVYLISFLRQFYERKFTDVITPFPLNFNAMYHPHPPPLTHTQREEHHNLVKRRYPITHNKILCSRITVLGSNGAQAD
jgi:hypothetical protein